MDAAADAVVDGLLDGAPASGVVVDAVPQIAHAVPMRVVPDFVGFPEDCRHRLLEWADAATEAGGPVGERTPGAVALAVELGRYADGMVAGRHGTPGSLVHDLLAAADEGRIAEQQCPALLLDYFGPSLETTLTAIGNAVELFSRFPDQWDRLRDDPGLALGAFNEVLRLETPVRAFSRVAVRDTEVAGCPVPAGSRVAVLFASANRDERKWDRPEEFDITRPNADHLALGYGSHGCAGQGLARLEVTAVLTRLARRVRRIEPAGEPVRKVHSLVRGLAHLPVRLLPA